MIVRSVLAGLVALGVAGEPREAPEAPTAALPAASPQDPAQAEPEPEADADPAAAQDREPGDDPTVATEEDVEDVVPEQAEVEPEERPTGLARGDVTPEPGGRVIELTLDGAWSVALERNLSLKLQELARDEARYLADSSWGSLDWVLTSRAAYTDATFQARDFFSADSEQVQNDTQSFRLDLVKPLVTGGTFNAGWTTDNTRTTNELSRFDTQTADVLVVGLVQPLLRGGWRAYATTFQRQSEIEYQRQVEIERASRQALLLDVANAYWDLVSAREQLSVARSNLDLGHEQERQARLRLDAEVGTEFDVLQASTQVATREERELFFAFQVRQAMDRLKQLLFPGIDAELWETTLIPLTPLPAEVTVEAAPPWYQCVQTAFDNRSELRQQRLLIDQAEVRHRAAVSERLAALDLSLSAASEGFDNEPEEAFSESLSYEFPTYQASLVYSVPIGNNGPRNAEKAAWVAVRSARLNYDRIESDIVAEARQAARQVVYQAQAVDAAEKSLVLARRQLEVERARFEQELTTTFQLLDFQQQLFDAESQERRARVDYARALVALDAALGILGETAR